MNLTSDLNLAAKEGVGSSALDEETARAEVYGLLAALYYAPPTTDLLAMLRVATTQDLVPGAAVTLGFHATDCRLLAAE